MKKPDWQQIELRPSMQATARRRIAELLEASIAISRAHEQDALDTYGVSCYLRGVEDGYEVRDKRAQRTEGSYEEER